MPRVLLTRPQSDSEPLALALRKLGYETVIEPLLEIQPVQELPPDSSKIQAVMLTSAHALDFLDRHGAAVETLRSLPCYCVGARTAAAAQAFGFACVENADGDGLALAALLQQNRQSAQGALLHITARDADSRGREALQQAGFTVQTWVTYQAEATPTLSSDLMQLLRAQKLDAVLLFSPRTAGILQKLLGDNRLQACCKNVIAIGISDIVIGAVADLPWLRRAATSSPTTDAVLQRLQEFLPVS